MSEVTMLKLEKEEKEREVQKQEKFVDLLRRARKEYRRKYKEIPLRQRPKHISRATWNQLLRQEKLLGFMPQQLAPIVQQRLDARKRRAKLLEIYHQNKELIDAMWSSTRKRTSRKSSKSFKRRSISSASSFSSSSSPSPSPQSTPCKELPKENSERWYYEFDQEYFVARAGKDLVEGRAYHCPTEPDWEDPNLTNRQARDFHISNYRHQHYVQKMMSLLNAPRSMFCSSCSEEMKLKIVF